MLVRNFTKRCTEIERATVMANMNNCIRDSGLLSREICFKPNLISNEHKHIDELKLAENILKQRKLQHNKQNNVCEAIQIGHNVFLKSDASKLRARELYVVVDTYEKQNEVWATIQKRNSQFRTRKYEVKLAELMLLPGQSSRVDLKNEDNAKKQPRKAAILARRKIASMYVVRASTINDLPTHGFDFKKMMELALLDEEDTYLLNPELQTQDNEETSTQ